jgi:methylamine---glutamate N-methyltransferase subunit C
MSKYICNTCGYVHDEEVEGVAWQDLPNNWTCPLCDSAKEAFQSKYICNVCGYIYDEGVEGVPWDNLPGDYVCAVCGSPKDVFEREEPSLKSAPAAASSPEQAGPAYLAEWARPSDEVEGHMADIHRMAETGMSISEPMRARETRCCWEEIYVKGAQLATLPLSEEVPVRTQTVIGPKAGKPLVIETPLYVSHMSFGALSREAKIALAKGSAAAQTAMCSGEGGILSDSLESAYRYIFEYVPNLYGVTEENLKRVDAIEIKIGQSAKPGLGGHLPGKKVTKEIAEVRGRPEGQDITSPAHFADIRDKDELKAKVAWLREISEGRPIGIKFAAGNIEADLEVALYAEPDFVTIDGRAGGTGSAPKFVKAAASVPTVFALHRARKYLDEHDAKDVSLVITGGFRVSSDFAKAFALGADAVAVATATMIAIGCQQYRICNTGNCPVGITSQDPALRSRLDVAKSADRLTNYLTVCTEELKSFARMTGNDDVHKLAVTDLCTVNSEISDHTLVEHV